MMRRDLFNLVGGYDPAFSCSQDYNLMVRMMGSTKFAKLNEVLLQYRIHPDKVSNIHELLQMEKSAENSMMAISKWIERGISLEQTKIIRGFLKSDDQEIINAINILNDLYLTFVAKSNLSKPDRKIISEDAGSRVLHLSKTLSKYPSKIIAFKSLLRIYPLFTINRSFDKLKRVL